MEMDARIMTTIAILMTALAGGAIAAGLYYAVLMWNVRALVSDHGIAPIMLAPVLRLAIVITAFGLAVTQGMPALLVCLAGFLAVRMAVLRRMRDSAP